MNIFKKIPAFLIILTLGFLVYGCAGTEEDPQPNSGQNGNGGTPTPTVTNCTDPLATNYNQDATDDDCSCTYNTNGSVSETLPTSFTKKAVIEYVTATWCGYCPETSEHVQTTATTRQDQAYPITLFLSNNLETNMSTYISQTFAVNAIPKYIVNRKKINNQFLQSGNPDRFVKNIVGNSTTVGLALETALTSNNEIEVLVYTGVQAEGKYLIHVVLTEDGMTGYPQTNYYNNDSGSNYYQKGDPIVDYVHNSVQLATLTDLAGFEVPGCGLTAGSTYKRMFKLETMPGKMQNKDNLKIVAFVADKDTGEILNAQSVKVGQSHNWD
ncbi:hypothetical protein BKI52_40940 [marine bacterium AO1-C]|nr:hypothetical protein BKI52_40940 [marine bacterium AO1-C]